MRIVLLNPPFKPEKGRFSRSSRSPAITKSGTIYYPLWLSYATGVLEKQGHSVLLIDAPAEGSDAASVFKRIKHHKPRLVVVDTSTPSIYSDIEIAADIKKGNPGVCIVLVGTHVSALPRETLAMAKEIDAVAVGEYDYTLRDLAKAIEAKKSYLDVPGLVLNGKDITATGTRDKIADLDNIPFVSEVYKKHLDIRKYFFGAAQYPLVQIISGRGCPNYCSFCVYPQVFHSRKYRARSAENVVAEFEFIRKELPFVKEIGIEDDTFTVDRKRVKKICELIIEKRLRPSWYTNVRADLDYDTMRWMKRAGCRMITVGFESGDQKVLNNIRKGITLRQIEMFVKNAKRAGLFVHAAYMVGNMGETKKSMEKTLQMAKKLNTDMAQFFPIMLYPGTESYEWAKNKGYVTTEDYSKWLTEEGQYDCVLTTNDLNNEELFAFCDRALREYYFRPRYLWMKLAQSIAHPAETYRNLRSGMHLLSNLKIYK